MKAIIRGLLWNDPVEKPTATENFKIIRKDRLRSLTKTQEKVLEDLLTFYTASQEAPSLQFIFDSYEKANDVEAANLVEETSTIQHYTGATFEAAFEQEVEKQATDDLIGHVKKAVKIATEGETNKGVTVKGPNAAIDYLFTTVVGPPPKQAGGVPSHMTEANQALKDLYQQRKNNPLNTYGVLTGYGLFDQSTAGIRKKQLYLHAGFGGHLKTTHMLNMVLNAAVEYGWNPLVFESEMPQEDVQIMMVCIHSANPRFNGVGRPLNAFRTLLGQLQPQEEAFYNDVLDDLTQNPNHGHIRVIDVKEFTTFGSVMQRTIREHMKEEVDIMWTDYITRLPIDLKYMKMDITSARNETLAEAKRFAMGFDKGRGLAVCSPFQINREGYKRAKEKLQGRYDKTSLAQYNAAEREADVITYIWYDEEEQKLSEPKVGIIKSRWGAEVHTPVSLYIEPDSRRIFDMSQGMQATAIAAPTMSATGAENEVEI